MLRTFWRSSCVPVLKLKLFWNGTEIRLAIGFWACFANSGVSWARAGEAAANSATKRTTGRDIDHLRMKIRSISAGCARGGPPRAIPGFLPRPPSTPLACARLTGDLGEELVHCLADVLQARGFGDGRIRMGDIPA